MRWEDDRERRADKELDQSCYGVKIPGFTCRDSIKMTGSKVEIRTVYFPNKSMDTFNSTNLIE
jgi:hypothetical protein